MYREEIYLILLVYIVCAWLAVITTPSTNRDPQLFQLGGRGH